MVAGGTKRHYSKKSYLSLRGKRYYLREVLKAVQSHKLYEGKQLHASAHPHGTEYMWWHWGPSWSWSPALLVAEHASFLNVKPYDGSTLYIHLDVAKLCFH